MAGEWHKIECPSSLVEWVELGLPEPSTPPMSFAPSGPPAPPVPFRPSQPKLLSSVQSVRWAKWFQVKEGWRKEEYTITYTLANGPLQVASARVVSPKEHRRGWSGWNGVWQVVKWPDYAEILVRVPKYPHRSFRWRHGLLKPTPIVQPVLCDGHDEKDGELVKGIDDCECHAFEDTDSEPEFELVCC